MKSISKGCILPDGRLNVLIDSASTLTGNDIGDPSQVAPLLDQIEATIASVTADGAYDGMPTYAVVECDYPAPRHSGTP